MRSNTQSSPLDHDVRGVVSDAKELLKTVREDGGAKLAEVGSKVRSQVDSARETLAELQRAARDGAGIVVKSTDTYVRSNPWRAAGVGAALGAIIGYLAGRRY